MYRNILVVVEGRAPIQPALRRALRSLPAEAAITVLDVVHEPALDGYLGHRELYEPLRKRLVAERQQQLEPLIPRERKSGITAKAVWGHPRDETVEAEAALAGADLVVTSVAADGGLTSSDWRLVAGCPVPVLLVRGDAGEPYRRIVAAVDPFHAHAKAAELDAAILAHARAMQAASGAALVALHCRMSLPPLGAGMGPAEQSGDAEAADEAARRRALAALLAANGVPPGAARIEAGVPHEVLRELAARGEADLIVMGVLARGRLQDLIVGHTAERVLHRGAVDVLVVKPAPSSPG